MDQSEKVIPNCLQYLMCRAEGSIFYSKIWEKVATNNRALTNHVVTSNYLYRVEKKYLNFPRLLLNSDQIVLTHSVQPVVPTDVVTFLCT